MKSSTIQFCLLGATVLALTATTRQAEARGDSEATSQSGVTLRSVVVRGEPSGSSKSKSSTVEINTDDDKVSVRVDGKEIPAGRLRFEGGRVIVLDEDGNEMKSFNLYVSKPDKEHAQQHKKELKALAEAQAADGEAEAEPPVMLGIQMSDPSEALQRHLHLEPGTTSMVIALHEGLPAQKAGLDEYDIIVAVSGKRPAGPSDIREILAGKSPGDELRLTVIHEGQTVERTVKLEAYDAERLHGATVIGQIMVAPGDDIEWGPGPDWSIEHLWDPNTQQWFLQNLQKSEWGAQLREQLKQHLPQDLDSRLEHLNQRIDEIKEAIDALILHARDLAREEPKPKTR